MKRTSKGLLGYLLMIGIFILLVVLLSNGLNHEDKRIEYPKLLDMIASEQVDRVSIRGTELVGRKKDSRVSLSDYPNNYDFETTIGYDFIDTVCKMYASAKQKDPASVSVNDLGFEIEYLKPLTTPWYLEFLPYLISIGLMVGLFVFMMRQQGGGKISNFGRSHAPMFDPGRSKITFADVAGADEEKDEMKEIVDFLKNPKPYSDLGARIPKGVLLVGPPGTGKTLLAKAVAGEAGVPFFSISGSDFVEMFVGVGASRVRDLFEQAKRAAPSIVFIDEIDAVGRHRGAGLGGGHDEREQTLNQLLVEMDGFAPNEGVIVMAATNRKDILDPALMRPGRFDRQITVNYPDINGRLAVLKVHAKNKPLDEDVDLDNIAKRTPFATGADLENVMNEAAILAARGKQSKVTQANLVEAVERIQMGPEKRSHKVLEEDLKVTAYHEAGHAILGYLLPQCDEVHMITVVPRGQAAGLTLALPEKELDHTGKNKLLQMITMMLGGRAAESLTQNDICTGAVSDLQRATEVARAMVTKYGMSERLGTVYLGSDQEIFVGMEFGQNREYSEQTAALIDEEVRLILQNAYREALNILRDNRGRLVSLAEMLIQKETINHDEFITFMENTQAVPVIASEEELKAEEEKTPVREWLSGIDTSFATKETDNSDDDTL